MTEHLKFQGSEDDLINEVTTTSKKYKVGQEGQTPEQLQNAQELYYSIGAGLGMTQEETDIALSEAIAEESNK